MFIENQIPNKRQDEEPVLFLRRHWLILLGQMLFYAVLFILPILVIYMILLDPKQFVVTQTTFPFLLLFGSAYYLFIWLLLYNAYIDYNLDVWIVTSKRIINIEQKGLFNRLVSEQDLERIQDVTSVQKGILATFFSFGDIEIQTAGEKRRFIFKQIDNPFEVVKTINHLIQESNLHREQKYQMYKGL